MNNEIRWLLLGESGALEKKIMNGWVWLINIGRIKKAGYEIKGFLAAGEQKKRNLDPGLKHEREKNSREVLSLNLAKSTVPKPGHRLGKNETLKYLSWRS